MHAFYFIFPWFCLVYVWILDESRRGYAWFQIVPREKSKKVVVLASAHICIHFVLNLRLTHHVVALIILCFLLLFHLVYVVHVLLYIHI